MRMLIAPVHIQLGKHVRRQLVLRQHTFHRRLYDCFRLAHHALVVVFRPQAARIAGVMVVLLLLSLHAGGADLLRVEDDHVIPGIEKWRIPRVLFAHQDARDLRSQAPERLPVCIHDVPLAHNFPLFGEIGRHKLSQN